MPAPAAQVAPAMVQLIHSASGQQVTLRLAPDDLGRVDIRIDRGSDGTTSVQVVVERPETLKLLQADQPQLNQALNQAGLPQEGRSLSLSLALPDPGQPGGGFADGQSGGTRQQPGGQPGAAAAAEPAFTTTTPPVPAAGWRRAGINITA